MCNRYRNYIRKMGLEFERWGYEEFSETRIKIRLGNQLSAVGDEAFPDSPAIVARLNENGVLSPDVMRWGFPRPTPKPTAEDPNPKTPSGYVTNVREVKSPFWGAWLKPQYRCLVPFTAFSEYDDRTPKGAKVLRWFEPTDGETAAFAGIWRPWTGERGTKANPVSGDHLVFSFLTCPPNAIVAPVHGKAMPVVLAREHWNQWLTGSVDEALALQRPAPDDAVRLAE